MLCERLLKLAYIELKSGTVHCNNEYALSNQKKNCGNRLQYY